MQSWNAAFFLFFVGYSLGGGGDLGSGSGSKFNRAARVGSGWVRQSRVRAGFGLQFWARADLYPVPQIYFKLYAYEFSFVNLAV